MRVVSLGTFVAGNICALLLGELGADVVKIESRSHPEPLRSYDYPGHERPAEPSGVRTTALFAGLTRSMRSAAIDLAVPAGRDLFLDLVAEADAVVENLAPGTLERWGCDFATMSARNPRLVVLSISGYGRTGAMAGYRAYASNIGNFVGFTEAWAWNGTYFDFVAGVQGASAVVAGLSEAARSGNAQHLDLAQTEAGAVLLAPLYLDFLANDREWEQSPNEVPGAWLSAVVRCSGPDHWLAVEVEDADDWRALCHCLDRADLAGVAPPGDPDAARELAVTLERWAGDLSPLQAAWRLQRAGVAAGPVQNAEDLWRDAQHRARGAFAEIDHPDLGRIEYPGAVGRLSTTPARIASRAARLGEHTHAVLTEWLGLSPTALEDLGAAGAVWLPGAPEPTQP